MTEFLSLVAKSIATSRSRERRNSFALNHTDLAIVKCVTGRQKGAFLSKVATQHGVEGGKDDAMINLQQT